MTFEGKWTYQSYRVDPGSLATDSQGPKLIPWSPPGALVTIDQGGATGTLMFPTTPPMTLTLKLEIKDGTPATLRASAVMPLGGGKQFTNELHGWFVPARLGEDLGTGNPLVVRGSIVQTSPDIAHPPQPIFTAGFFVLEPA